MSNISVILKKYSIPFLFFVVGISMVVIGVVTTQNNLWFIASLMALAAGTLSIIYSGGFLKMIIGKVIGVVAGICAIIALYFASQTVNETVEEQKLIKETMLLVQQNLSDVRAAQKAYREKNGVFAHTWDELEEFMKNGLVPEVVVEGDVPARKLTMEENAFLYSKNKAIDNNMTEMDAYRLSKAATRFPEFANFKRDTVMVNFFERQFNNKSYLQRRDKAGFGKLYVDSLKFIPLTKGKEMFTMTALDSIPIGADMLPALEVKGTLPFKLEGKKVEISFGSLTTADLSGSWE
jgi:hypothetical protein